MSASVITLDTSWLRASAGPISAVELWSVMISPLHDEGSLTRQVIERWPELVILTRIEGLHPGKVPLLTLITSRKFSRACHGMLRGFESSAFLNELCAVKEWRDAKGGLRETPETHAG